MRLSTAIRAGDTVRPATARTGGYFTPAGACVLGKAFLGATRPYDSYRDRVGRAEAKGSTAEVAEIVTGALTSQWPALHQSVKAFPRLAGPAREINVPVRAKEYESLFAWCTRANTLGRTALEVADALEKAGL